MQTTSLPESSVAVKVIIVTPTPTSIPAIGSCVIVGDVVQLSVADAVEV